jgi:N-acetyl-anhydromuramyl-L-alanine amidase AmpD
MNVGPLYEKDGSIYSVAENRIFTGPGVSGGPPKYKYNMWEAYTPEQMRAVCDITKKLLEEFPIIKSDPTKRMIGHEDVDPTRKTDVGPAFRWDELRAVII